MYVSDVCVVSGLEEVGRNLYGVLPVRGKLLNVCEVKLGKVKGICLTNTHFTTIHYIILQYHSIHCIAIVI